MSAAVKFSPRDHDVAWIDAAVARIWKTKGERLSLDEMRKKGQELGGAIWGVIAVIEELKHPALKNATDDDLMRVAQRIQHRIGEREREREEARRAAPPNASGFRAIVERHLSQLKHEAAERKRELDLARKALEDATKLVADHDVEAHRLKMRGASENVSVLEIRFASANAKADTFAQSLKSNKKRYDELVNKATAGSAIDWQRRIAPLVARLETHLTAIFQTLAEAADEVRKSQIAAQDAERLAEELGVPRLALHSMRPPDDGNVRGLMTRIGKSVLGSAKMTPSQAADLIHPKSWW